LSTRDYQGFNGRNPYLAAKLLTIFVEHPIVFLGYSLTDENVRSILLEIARCLSSANIGRLRDRLIFVNWEPSASTPQLAHSIFVLGESSVPIIQINTASFLPVYETLSEYRRVFPARTLRLLREHVFELVRTNDPAGRLYVADLDSSNLSDNDLVIGVGAISSLGYKSITRDDLLRDAVFAEGKFDAERIVKETLPTLIRGASKFFPVFRYLRKAGYLLPNGALGADHGLSDKVVKAAVAPFNELSPPIQYQNRKTEVDKKFKSFAEMDAEYGPADVVNYVALLGEAKLSADEVERFLIQHWAAFMIGKKSGKTQFGKLVCIYDRLCFRESTTL